MAHRHPTWSGDHKFLFANLISKDFKIRYRNMSLGVFWSLLNPLIMMGVLTFVFTRFFPNPAPDFPLFVLTGIVVFNFFTGGWAGGTTSLTDNAGLIKRVPVPREVMPIASVCSVFVHILIQIALLLALTLGYGKGINVYWIWIPVLWGLLITFVCGLAFLFSAIHVYIRDTRYVVESANTVMFWLVPVFYDISFVPATYHNIYLTNPVAAVIVSLRQILLKGSAPSAYVLIKLTVVSFLTLALGYVVFRSLKTRLYNYL